MATASGKVCIVCGQDCSAKPRTKDPQGRYTCKECFDKLAAKRAQTAAPPAPRPAAPPKPAARPQAPPVAPLVEQAPDDDVVMAGLLKDVPAMTETCPSCGAGMLAGAAVCTMCGYNKETGRTLATKALKAPKERKIRTGPAFSLTPGMTFLIGIVVFGTPAALTAASPDMAVVGYGVLALFGLVLVILTLIAGFKESPTTGVILLVTLFIPIASLYWLYWIFSRNEDERLKAAWGANILGGIGFAAVVLATGGSLPGR
jgi:hypothetical protein